MTDSRRIEELRAEARYHRERFELYRAKMHGPRPTSMGRFRELERTHEDAEARLRRAEEDAGRSRRGDSNPRPLHYE